MANRCLPSSQIIICMLFAGLTVVIKLQFIERIYLIETKVFTIKVIKPSTLKLWKTVVCDIFICVHCRIALTN